MARIFKEDEYNAKRNEILDFALSLVYSKGYEQMTIQDILEGLQISKGFLYHYFDSKQAMLNALVDRMGQAAEQSLLPIVQDPDLPALQKFRRYFEGSASWKTAQKPLIVNILRTWYSDDNIFIRQKLTVESMKHTARLIEVIIRQGIAEKVFTTRFPEQIAKIIAGVSLSLTDTIVELLLSPTVDPAVFQKLEDTLDAYVDTLERILGAPSGSLKVFEAEAFREWFVALQPELESK
jgi:AcrR family transcriptional regulator